MRRVLSLEVTKGDSQCPAASTRVHLGGGVGSLRSPTPPPKCFYRKDHALPFAASFSLRMASERHQKGFEKASLLAASGRARKPLTHLTGETYAQRQRHHQQ